MTVEELIKELEKLPKYATVRVLRSNTVTDAEGEYKFYSYGKAKKVTLKPFDDDDAYLERYVDIK